MGDSLISVYREYQMDPAFHRLRDLDCVFVAGGVRLDADVVFVFDRPTPTDRLGEMLAATGLSEDKVFVTCLVKYDDPTPSPQEIRDSRPYLKREMKFLKPKVICPLGKGSLKFFVDTGSSFEASCGHEYRTRAGTPVVPVAGLHHLDRALECLSDKEFRTHEG